MKKMKAGIFAMVAVTALCGTACKSQRPDKLTMIPGVRTIVQNPATAIPAGPGIPTTPPPGGTVPNPGGTTGTPKPLPGGPGVTDTNRDPMNADFPSNFENNTPDRQAFLAQMVHFDYDSAIIPPGDLPKIEIVARHLTQQTKHLMVLEGHCDERGTEQYNLSLGERRAQAIRDQLVKYGISSDRVRTLSFGEEIPLIEGNSESARAKNRRGEFVLMLPKQ